MSKRFAAVCASAALFAASSIWAQTASPGHVNYQELAYTALDTYTDSPTAAQQEWMQSHFMWMGVFTPYFDLKTSWYPNALVYIDLYAIYPGSEVLSEHPEWVLHDQNGNPLYIPWNCSGGTCPEYAADIANPAFRTWWISNAQTIVNRGNYPGIWIDDVNTNFEVSDGSGNPVAPIDFNTGEPMTWTAWRAYVAQFTAQIRGSFPNSELVENSVWSAGPTGPAGTGTSDPSILQQNKTASNINLERGIASDPGITGGTGQYSVYAFFNYVDQVHALGLNVTLEEYQVTPAQQQYGLASYFMISNGSDRIGDMTSTPDNWWSGYDVELGTPLGPRTYTNGVYERYFTNGIVLLGEPGLATQTITLPAPFTTVAGASVTSVSLSGSQGIILTGSTAVLAAPPALPAHTPPSIVRYLSALTPSYVFQSWGTPQDNKTVIGEPIKLDGVQYANGLGVHAYSELHYPLQGNCTLFTATAGVDDEIPAGLGSLAFQVWADGYKLYDSGTMTSGSPVAHVIANLTGKQTLSLVVTNGIYDAPSWAVPDDHADWAIAQITCTQ